MAWLEELNPVDRAQVIKLQGARGAIVQAWLDGHIDMDTASVIVRDIMLRIEDIYLAGVGASKNGLDAKKMYMDIKYINAT